MLKLNVRTRRSPADVVKKALEFFGAGGYGLKATQQGDTCVSFEGGGGDITVIAYADNEGASVDLETREWEHQLREFARKIK